jgi:hypothetical protein
MCVAFCFSKLGKFALDFDKKCRDSKNKSKTAYLGENVAFEADGE